MRARDLYELERNPAPGRGRWWRRLGQLITLVINLGPVPGGGGRTLIVERATGNVIGHVKQPFGDDFYDARIEEDLLTVSVDDFRDKWLSSSDT
jgi:hypothetical protein